MYAEYVKIAMPEIVRSFPKDKWHDIPLNDRYSCVTIPGIYIPSRKVLAGFDSRNSYSGKIYNLTNREDRDRFIDRIECLKRIGRRSEYLRQSNISLSESQVKRIADNKDKSEITLAVGKDWNYTADSLVGILTGEHSFWLDKLLKKLPF